VQLVYMPEIAAHSAIFLAVESLKRDPKGQHLRSLMNAVLRRAQANAARYWSLPEELLIPAPLRARWARRDGEDALAPFGAALLAGAPLDLTLKDNDPGLIAELGAHAVMADTVRITSRDRTVDALAGFSEGRWWVQDAAAAIPARLLRFAPGARVLDLCAAPGGKTAQLCKAGAAVTAIDLDPQRLERAGNTLRRLGYAPELVAADAASYRSAPDVGAVLLDAPCSATGTFRRHPEVLWHASEDGVANRVALQRQLIENAVACLRPGGSLIYCVCSLEPEEGEGQAAWIRKALPILEPDPISTDELPALPEAITPEGHVRTHPGLTAPGPEGGTLDGFFIARFRRRG
jgi:16S rRNA (cytosine967-C5)-methyltransferase